MEFKCFCIFAFLSVVCVSSHAEMGPQEYWKSALPNTPMPNAVKDLLMTTLLLQPFTKWVENFEGTGTQLRFDPAPILTYYAYAATEAQLHDFSNLSIFFFEKDLHAGKRKSVYLYKSRNHAKFLPRQVADLVPFSSKDLPEILTKFRISPDSDGARAMKKTIERCEGKDLGSEERRCATSLESMVEFSTSNLGKDIEALFTRSETGEIKEYNVIEVKKSSGGASVVACHKLLYPYAVYYCHKAPNMAAYKVSLMGVDGAKANGVVVCHQDTSEWNPRNFALQVLKVKPGSLPVCNFLPADHIVWAKKN